MIERNGRRVLEKNNIVFRGKDRYGSWVYGDLVVVGDHTAIVDNNRKFYSISRLSDESMNVSCVLVDRNTVGQYVKKTDSGGNPIFEGDIIEMFYGGPLSNGRPETDYHLVPDITRLDDVFTWGEVGKILGNQWDNPELLDKVGDLEKYHTAIDNVVADLRRLYPKTSFAYNNSEGEVIYHNNRRLSDEHTLITNFVDLCKKHGIASEKLMTMAICYDFAGYEFNDENEED